MICKIKETIEKYGMFSSCRNVTVGISGGADSCTLLHVLCSLKEEYSLNITAAHVNHGIRGGEADRDENFVKDFCSSLGVELKILHCNVPALAKKSGMGLEECGRKVRYEFFESIDPSALIATAHNLSDRCETLLFNISRGTSAKGLASIPAVRGNIIRPLICCSRTEIEKYCRENNINYVTDSTNADDSYTRNRIRLNVIPELKKINPSFESAAARLIDGAEYDNDYFASLVKDLLERAETAGGYDANILLGEHPAVRSRAIFYLIEKETGKIPEASHVKSVESILSGGKTQVLGGIPISVKGGKLVLGEEKKTESWCFDAEPEKEIVTPTASVNLQIIHNSSAVKIQFVHKNVLDFESIVGKLVLRSRREGDEIKIAGRKCTKKIKKMFVEAKIADKNAVCILADEKGPVWVEGFGCAERCKVKKNTSLVLKADVKRGTKI